MHEKIAAVVATGAGDDYQPGELDWDTRRGSLLHRALHLPLGPATTELVRVYVSEAVARQLPGVRVTDVTVQESNTGLLRGARVTIRWARPGGTRHETAVEIR